MEKAAPPSDCIQSVVRALSILEYIASHDASGASAKEIAGKQQLNLATTYHMLNTLAFTGYVEKLGKGYRVSSAKIYQLLSQLEPGLTVSPEVIAAMRGLAELTHETTYAACFSDHSAVIVAVAEGTQAVRVANIYVGLRGSEYARASGKVLLAYMSDGELQDYLNSFRLRPSTPHTIVAAEALREELVTIRHQGYAVDQEEYVEGVCCIAAPIERPDGSRPIVTLAITMPAQRFDAMFAKHLRALLMTTASLGQKRV